MGAHKDRLIQAAELLGMSPDDLLTLLESAYRYPFADSLVGIARERQARILSATRVDPEDARTLARAFRELDIHLSAGGTPPVEWREGPDAPGTGSEPRGISFSREQVEAWAGYPMTDEQVADLEDVLPNSTFPETVGLVAEAWRRDDVAERLEYLRAELRAERISQGELIELQDLAAHIDPGDVELLEAAGVPEFPEDDEPDREPTPAQEEAWDAREDEARGRILGADEDPEYGVWRGATSGEADEWHAGHRMDGLEYRETDHGVEVREV